MDVVLHCAGHHDINLAAEGLLAGEEFNAKLVGIILHAVAAACVHLEHVVDLFGDNAIGIIDVTIRTGQGDNFAAQLCNLLGYAPSNVAETGNRNGFTFDGIVLMVEDFAEVINSTETGCFRTDQGAAEGEALAGQHAVFICAYETLILAEHIANLTAAYAQVTSRNVHAGANVAIELAHERLAETHRSCRWDRNRNRLCRRPWAGK